MPGSPGLIEPVNSKPGSMIPRMQWRYSSIQSARGSVPYCHELLFLSGEEMDRPFSQKRYDVIWVLTSTHKSSWKNVFQRRREAMATR